MEAVGGAVGLGDDGAEDTGVRDFGNGAPDGYVADTKGGDGFGDGDLVDPGGDGGFVAELEGGGGALAAAVVGVEGGDVVGVHDGFKLATGTGGGGVVVVNVSLGDGAFGGLENTAGPVGLGSGSFQFQVLSVQERLRGYFASGVGSVGVFHGGREDTIAAEEAAV